MASASTLTVWVYDSAMGAAAGEIRLKDLQQRGALAVHDAVTVTWVHGAHEPRVGHLRHGTGSAGRSSVLGALLGALVLSPGADAGALARRLRGTGIDREFLHEVTTHLQPGTSALVVLSSHSDIDAVRPAVERGRARGDVVLLLADLAEGAPAALDELLRSPGGPDGTVARSE